MWRIMLLVWMAMSLAATAMALEPGEVEKLVIDGARAATQASPAMPADDAAPAREPSAPGEDDHYIQRDDFFISEQPLGTQEWIYVLLSKMVTSPSARTKGEGEFFKVTDGNKQWTRNFWRSRIVKSGELRLGTVVIIFEGSSPNGVYQAPDAKDNARSGSWFMAKVTDLSDLYKGYVTVSGGYKASPKNMRVIVK